MRSTALLALLFIACAPASGGPDGGDAGTAGEGDPAYFGLEAGKCFLFDEAGGFSYTVHVETNPVVITGKTVFTLTHRANGAKVRVDYLEVTADGARLHRRDEHELGGQGQDVWRFTGAPLFLSETLSSGEPLETSTPSIHETNTAGQVEGTHTLKTEMVEEVELTTPAGAFQAKRLLFTLVDSNDVPIRTDRLWFAPGTGLVKIDPHGSDLKEATFKGYKVLDPTSSGQARYCIEDT